MPVDQHKNIDAEYLDDSWGMMRELLDKELPITDNKPKPPNKSWLTLLLVLLFAWTTYLYWPENLSLQEEEQPAVEKPVELIDAVQAPIAKIETLTPKTKAKIPASAVQQELNQIVDIHTTQRKNIEDRNRTAKRFEQPFVDEVKNKVKLASNNVSKFFSEEKPLLVKSDEVLSEGSDSPTEVLDAKFELINNLGPKELSFLDPNANQKFWSVGLKYEGIVDRRLPSGKFFGIQFTKQLSNQFAVQTGIGITNYNKLNPSENSFEAFSDVLSMELNSVQDDLPALKAGMPIKYDDSDDKVSVIGINKLNYVTVPFELIFSVNSKCGVIAGIGVSYLMSADFTARTQDHVWVSHENGQVVNEEKLLLGTALNRLDIAPSIGFVFYPTKRIGIDLKFRNGLIDISKDKFLGFNEHHSNRYLHLGVSYDVFKF